MPTLTQDTIATIDDVQEYARGMTAKAKHHAPNIVNAILPVIGSMILRKDAGSPVTVRRNAADGQLTPALTVWIGRRLYWLLYSHDADAIVIRQGSMRGSDLYRIDNSTPLPGLYAMFENL